MARSNWKHNDNKAVIQKSRILPNNINKEYEIYNGQKTQRIQLEAKHKMKYISQYIHTKRIPRYKNKY